MTTMKAAVHKSKGAQLEIVEMVIPEPSKGQVRIKVLACGVCAGDAVCKYGAWGNTFPRVPGHEIVGTICKLGDDVTGGEWKLNQLVGVGWFGGNHCGVCEDCKEDSWVHCKKVSTCGISYDGGYAEYMIAPINALVSIPDGMDPIESSPLLCAGVTVFNSIRNQNIKAGSLVGVQGIGGLGHLAIQFCRKLGYRVIAMSSSNKKEKLSMELGATHYIDMSENGWVDKMKLIGSVKCIMVTAPSASQVPAMIDALGTNGKLLMLAALSEPFNASSVALIGGNKSIVGWASGDSRDSQDTVEFAKLNNIKTMVNKYTLEQSNDAQSKISDARFRNVIVFE